MYRKSPVEGPQDPRHAVSEREALNRNALWTVGLTSGLALLIAAMLPGPLIPAALNALLFYAAVGALILAVIRGDALNAPHVTAWDQALMLLCGSLAAGLFIDPEQVAALVEEAMPAAGGAQ